MTTPRVFVNPRMLEWACERAGYTAASFLESHPDHKLGDWIARERQPTLKQLEAFANTTHTPLGALLLDEPPEEPLPIPDFRTMGEDPRQRASADLLDTIYLCQQRQDWYRSYAQVNRFGQVDFVGTASAADDPEAVAGRMRPRLAITAEERRSVRTWTEALSRLVEKAEAEGALVMISGVVGSNNTRTLDPHEFRGFALADQLAPVIFVNGRDTKAAQIFTLAHELGHLCLAESALDDANARALPDQDLERWCNRFAAELLVPREELLTIRQNEQSLNDWAQRVAEHFRVSTLVSLRRLYDVGLISRDDFWSAYDSELEKLREIARQGTSGGNFYYTTMARAGKRLTRALVSAALEGQSSFTESLHLLGFRKMATFNELARLVGVAT